MRTKIIQLTIIVFIVGLYSCTSEKNFPFNNPELCVDERVEDLISRMTIEEKISQMKKKIIIMCSLKIKYIMLLQGK